MLPRPKVEVIRLRPTSLPSKRNAARKGQGIWRVASTVGPGPKIHWTRSNNTFVRGSTHTSDQVQYTFGRGPIITPGPGPPYTAYTPMEAIIAGPGPTLKIGPRPKTPWTKSNNTLDQVQYTPRTRSNNNPWTWSNIYSLHANGSHYRWTWSNTQNRTTTKNTLDQVQQ